MENNTTTMYPLQKGDMAMIRSFIHYVHQHRSIFDPISSDWLSVMTEMLEEFRSDLTQIYKFNSVNSIHTTLAQTIPSHLSVATTPSSLLSQTPVDLFKHGIKRDFSAFPTLKDERNNDQWHHSVTTMAQTQNLRTPHHRRT
jgi:hypothetical protein